MLKSVTARQIKLKMGASLLAAGLMASAAAVPARGSDDIVVKYDQSELMQLPRPAAQIIVGNPTIADITVKSDKLLVITGKTFGITNMIILDSQSNIIASQRVLVKRDEAKVVNLQRGTHRQTYNCTPQCNPSIIIGDEDAYFDSVAKASQNKIGLSERAADQTQPNGSGPQR